ncbi:MAG: hypothetical protein Q8R79_08460, partial [Legionellaceae bacterium]|nr:hypothetical protein [Legionellaceae bacterium]
ELDFFKKYGGLYREQSTKTLLENYQAQQMAQWQKLLSVAQQPLKADEKEDIQKQIQDIVTAACVEGVCEKTQKSRTDALANEVEMQQVVQVEVLATKEIQKEMYDPDLTSEPYLYWSEIDKEDGFPGNKKSLQFLSLTDICKTTGDQEVPTFSDQIVASKNFYKSYTNQTKFVGMYLKPVHALLFQHTEEGLRCILLTQQEYAQIHQYSSLIEEKGNSAWISTTQHSILDGTPPPNIQADKNYQAIIEQVRFFNGEFQSLLNNREMDFVWLEEDSKKKLDFFSQYLRPCRETSSADIASLNTVLSSSRKIYKFIAKNPWIDRRHYNWRSQYPDAGKEDIATYQRVANAFYQTTIDWSKNPQKPLDVQECGAHLPLQASGYLTLYIEQLNALSQVFNMLNEVCEKSRKKQWPAIAIVCGLTTEIKEKLSTLCSDLENIFAGSKKDVDHDFLTTLWTVPILQSQPSVLMALAFDPDITEEQIDAAIEICAKYPSIRYALLLNPSPNINVQHLKKLHNLSLYPDHENILLEFTQHPLLKSGDPALLTTLAFNPFITEKQVQTLLQNCAQHPKMISGLLLNKSPNISAEHFTILSELGLLQEDKNILWALAQHPLILEQQFVPVLHKLKGSPLFSEAFLCILVRDMSLNTLQEILVGTVLGQQEIDIILEKSIQDESLNHLLVTQADAQVNLDVFANLPSAQTFQDNQLEKIINNTKKAEVIEKLQSAPHIGKLSWAAMAKNKASTTEILVSVSKKTTEKSAMMSIIKHPNANLAVFKNILDTCPVSHLPPITGMILKQLFAMKDKTDPLYEPLMQGLIEASFKTLIDEMQASTFSEAGTEKFKKYVSEMGQIKTAAEQEALHKNMSNLLSHADDDLPELMKQEELSAVVKSLNKCLKSMSKKKNAAKGASDTPEIKSMKVLQQKLLSFQGPIKANSIKKIYKACGKMVAEVKEIAIINQHRGFGRLPLAIRGVLGVVCSLLLLIEKIMGKQLLSASYKKTFFGSANTNTKKQIEALHALLENKK